ncbi:WXG100 family type VII secretion target [Actinomycetes bacterium M1A6_2h]
MMVAYSADLGRIDAAVASLQAFEDRLADELQTLSTRTERMRANWSGSSSDAFAQAQREWNDGAAHMAAGLARMRDAADVARTSYRSAVAANVAMFR